MLGLAAPAPALPWAWGSWACALLLPAFISSPPPQPTASRESTSAVADRRGRPPRTHRRAPSARSDGTIPAADSDRGGQPRRSLTRLRPAVGYDLPDVVDAGLRRLGADRDHELALDGAAVRRHGFGLAGEPGRNLVVDRVGAGLDRGHPPADVLALTRLDGPELERVRLSGSGACRRGPVEVLYGNAGRDQLRVFVLEDPHRPVGVGQVRVVDPDVERALPGPGRDRLRLLLAGVDRHREVWNRQVANVLDRQLKIAGLGEALLVRELRRRHPDRKVARRLGDVLALVASASGDAERDAQGGDSGCDPHANAPESRGPGPFGALLQGPGEHTTCQT